MSVENGSAPHDPLAEHAVHTTIDAFKGNTWRVRETAGCERLDATLVASPFQGVEIGQVALYPAGQAILEAEAAQEAPDATVYELRPTPATVAIAAAGC